MKSVTLSALGVVLTYLILISFGWIGLLVSLPFFFLAPFLIHWVREKWRRRNALR
jgi:Flp pilus assembly protein TadB